MSSYAGYLVVTLDPENPYFFELQENGSLEIGRKPSAPGGPRKLVIPVAEVSGRHAELRSGEHGWSVCDLGSTNGTRLNGQWLTPGQEYLLKNGDHIKVAQVDLVVNLPEHFPQRSDISQFYEEDPEEKTQMHVKLMSATILVADIRAFTALMEKYSAQPDLVMQASQRLFQRFGEEIQKEKGQIEKIAGDAVMAFWHSEESRQGANPDQKICANHACQAALRLKNLVEECQAKEEQWPFPEFPLQVDIALATGPVASGVAGAGTATMAILGDTANMAFRLEKLIGPERPGDIVMDASTYDLISSVFICESVGPVLIKGRSKPVEVYRLLASR